MLFLIAMKLRKLYRRIKINGQSPIQITLCLNKRKILIQQLHGTNCDNTGSVSLVTMLNFYFDSAKTSYGKSEHHSLCVVRNCCLLDLRKCYNLYWVNLWHNYLVRIWWLHDMKPCRSLQQLGMNNRLHHLGLYHWHVLNLLGMFLLWQYGTIASFFLWWIRIGSVFLAKHFISYN